ncbi:hypothetical protein D3C72_1603090 [compost metagenome]
MPCLVLQRAAQLAAEVVVGEQVHFDQDAVFGASDGVQPGGKVGRGVEQQLDTVAGHQRGTGRACQRLLRQLAEQAGRRGGTAVAHAHRLSCFVYITQ